MYKDFIIAINKVYELHGSGGYGHIVFDDFNVEDINLKYCMDEALKQENELATLCVDALLKLYPFSEEERNVIVRLAEEKR
jgi:hypothetical protein